MARSARAPSRRLAAAAPLVAAALLAIPAAVLAAETMHLSDGPWKLTNANGTLSYADVQVPAYPHQILQSKGVIGDPLYRYNELETRWISDDTWSYARDFVVSEAQATAPAADLLFKGLDTFAEVELNGAPILRADNFHRTWRVPVAGLLKQGKNTLKITLEPALATTLRLKKDMPYTVPTLAQPGALDVFNYVRKGAYAFGWGEFLVFSLNRRAPLFFRPKKKTSRAHSPQKIPLAPPTKKPTKQRTQTGAPPSPSTASTARSTCSRTTSRSSWERTSSRSSS
jgi:hypothetical protein